MAESSGARRGASGRWLLPALLALLALMLCGGAAAAPRIGVVTMQPGEIFFERFGHNAIVVSDPASGTATSYNFGYFDPTEEGFIARFIRGDMRYRLVALPLTDDLAYYRDVGRGVSVQWLNLRPGDARALAADLAWNARPENAHYGYDYFLDNCSTRVRDALDQALGGALRSQAGGSRGSTYRSEATRLASPDFWMWLGFDIGLGPAADRPLSFWDEAFVPMRLAHELARARNRDGAPLVTATAELLPHRLPPEPLPQAPRTWPWMLAGLALALAVGRVGSARPKLAAGVALPFWALCGLLAALMLFIWFGTGHRFGWENRNLLLFNPLCWLLLPAAWQALRGQAVPAWSRWVLAAVCGCGVVALALYGLERLPQRNLHWVLLLLPIHVALAWVFSGRPVQPPDRPLGR